MTMREHFMVSDCDGGLYDFRAATLGKLVRPNYSRHHREIGTVADLKASLRAGPFVWPGGYELAYLTADGACLCHECTRKEFRQIAEAIQTNDLRGGWAIGATVHAGEVDSEVVCDHCGRVIFEESE